MFGMKVLPCIRDLARQAYQISTLCINSSEVVPLLAPEYTEAAMAMDGSLVTVPMALQAGPYIANAASSIAQVVDNGLLVG